LAARTTRYADLVLFTIDGDINDVEYGALSEVHQLAKPLLVVINKSDIYSKAQREEIHASVRKRLVGKVKPENILFAAADPLEREVTVVNPDGSEVTEVRKPKPQIQDVALRVLEILKAENKDITALSASLFANEMDGPIRDKVIEARKNLAMWVVYKYMLFKAAAISLNPFPLADILSGAAVDATMVKVIGDVFGLKPSLAGSEGLIIEIVKAMGWLSGAELATHAVAALLKSLSLGLSTAVTAVPQAVAAGWSSYIVGRTSVEYYKNGGSWGGHGPGDVLKRILSETDAASIKAEVADHIRRKLSRRKASEP